MKNILNREEIKDLIESYEQGNIDFEDVLNIFESQRRHIINLSFKEALKDIDKQIFDERLEQEIKTLEFCLESDKKNIKEEHDKKVKLWNSTRFK